MFATNERVRTVLFPAGIDRTKSGNRKGGNGTDERRVDAVKVEVPETMMADTANQMGVFALDGTVTKNVSRQQEQENGKQDTGYGPSPVHDFIVICGTWRAT